MRRLLSAFGVVELLVVTIALVLVVSLIRTILGS
jgi:hypothetical protein